LPMLSSPLPHGRLALRALQPGLSRYLDPAAGASTGARRGVLSPRRFPPTSPTSQTPGNRRARKIRRHSSATMSVSAEEVEVVWALDFDGVLCDSVGESALSGWKSALIQWPELFGSADSEARKEAVLEGMRLSRPVVETGCLPQQQPFFVLTVVRHIICHPCIALCSMPVCPSPPFPSPIAV